MKLEQTDKEGLKKGIRSNEISYSVRDDRSRFFYPNEWISFINQVRNKNKLIYETLLQTGARISEALALKPLDFDWDRNNVTLRVTKLKARKNERVGKARTLNVSSQFMRKVRKYISDNYVNDSELLFNVHKVSVYLTMRNNLKKAGIKDWWNFGLHNIRKTTGNWLKALGVPAEEICLRLGHDYNTYLKHYGSPNLFDRKDKIQIVKILGDVYDVK